MRKTIINALIVLLVFGVIFSVINFYLLPNNFFLPNDTVVSAFEEGKLVLIVESEEVKSRNEPKITDGEILLPMDVVKKYFDPYIHWDEELQKLTVTTRDKVIRMNTDSLEALINNNPVTIEIPVTVEDGVVYVPIGFLSEFYNIEVSYIETNNVIVIDYKNSLKRIAQPVSSEAVIRKGMSRRHPILKKFDIPEEGASYESEENTLRVFEEYEKWYKVRASDGTLGYIEKRFVVIKRMYVTALPEQETKSPAWKPETGKINLVWEMMNGSKPVLPRKMDPEGIDVISPAWWFGIVDENGTLTNKADARYVEWAHNNGYKVWALLNNNFQDPDMTSKVLNNTDARDNIIRQILVYAKLYDLDGINIDFENIYKSDKDALTQFVRELTPILHEQGLVVSICVTVPDGSDNWSLCYDRKALGEIVDYMAVMTYDQHWASSPIAGSTAQISWVENNINKMLKLVPREKLLLGLPFYTRLWKEETDENGKVKVSTVKSLSMEEAKRLIMENGAEVEWDEESGQFYAEYKKDNALYRIWVEDENSMNLRTSLVQKYNLAGTAAWAMGFESKEVWAVLKENLKEINNYQAWKTEKGDIKPVFKHLE